MNIILINHYAGSPDMGMEFRPYYMAKHWREMGHKVVIIASNFHHLRIKQIEFDGQIFETTIDGIPYIFYKTPKYQGNSIKRVLNIFSFVRQLTADARKITKRFKPDAVIASSTYPADILPAYKIAKAANAKLIYEIHDLWPLTPMELGGMSRWHPFIFTLQYFENFAYRKSDAVVSILPNTKEHCVDHGLAPHKWHHVPNGIVVEEWNEKQTLPQNLQVLFENIKKQNKKIVGYVGGHAISNALDVLIETARILQEQKNIIFMLVGDGEQKKKLQKQASLFQNVIFWETLPKKQIPSLLEHFNILFLGWRKSRIYRFGISPNKLYDYMMSAKPIVHAHNAPNDIVSEAQCGISVEAENPQAIADAILNLLAKSDSELLLMGERGREYVLQNNDYKILSQKFIEIIQSSDKQEIIKK